MFAKTALYTRHPNMMNYPKDHRFYFAKMNIDNVILLAAFGGATHVNVDDYFTYVIVRCFISFVIFNCDSKFNEIHLL